MVIRYTWEYSMSQNKECETTATVRVYNFIIKSTLTTTCDTCKNYYEIKIIKSVIFSFIYRPIFT